MSALITRRLFTVADFLHMAEAGILGQHDRVELIHGEILAMSPIGSPHGGAIARALRTLVSELGNEAVVWIQSTVRLSDFDAPQPDIILLKPRDDFYTSKLPEPADMFLIIEVADSSLDYDRKIKAKLYAAAGVPEYWIADIQNDCIRVYSNPQGEAYQTCRDVRRGERITPQLLPAYEFNGDILLP